MARALPAALGRPVGPARATSRQHGKGERMTQSNTETEQALVIERVLDAPREQVWAAWTDPEQIKKWWGPKDFTAPSIKSDFREGGTYLWAMQSPDGQTYWNTGTFH